MITPGEIPVSLLFNSMTIHSIQKRLPTKAFGRVVMTAGFQHEFGAQASSCASHICRFMLRNDWGDIPAEDKQLNISVLKAGEGRLMASYTLNNDLKVWVISYISIDPEVQADPNCCNTTIMLPSDY